MNKSLSARLVQSSVARGLLGAAALVATASANAAIDVSAVVTDLGAVETAVKSIGVAVLAIYVGIKLYKWVKAAL